jgi:putative hemolysin
MSIDSPLIAILFLFGASLLTGTMAALQQMGRLHGKEELEKKFVPIKALFGERPWERLFLTLNLTQLVLQLGYAIFAFLFLLYTAPFGQTLYILEKQAFSWDLIGILMILLIVIGVSLCVDFLVSLFAIFRPKLFFKYLSPFLLPFLLLCSPLILIFIPLFRLCFPRALEHSLSQLTFRDKLLEILHESDLTPNLEPTDQKLILSVASFKEKIAREVMVPRIDMFCLAEDTTVEAAAQKFVKEGYSRIPVYKENIDHIIGVLLYKDVLTLYASRKSKDDTMIKTPIETLVKPVLYAPETKRISHLLQEFRSKQIHLAIVVDEYGGTEGIVTIEDILEELVGEIADEYDIEEDVLFTSLPDGGWIVDARMNILDIEEELKIKIPQSPEYDTVGGYIFHRAGAIPLRGWKIHQDEYDLEVLSSNERSIEKVRLTKTND